MKRFYWESEMRRICYGTDAQVRQKCIIYEQGNPDPIAECWDVLVANQIVRLFNEDVEKRR